MTDPKEPAPPTKRGSPLKWILLACGGCLFLACLCASGFALLLRQTTQPVVDAFQKHVQLVAAGQADQAWEETSQGFKRDCSRQQFQAFMEQQETLYAGTGFSFWQREVKAESGQPSTGWIQGTVTGPKGEVGVRVTFVSEEGAWRVHTIEPPR